MLKAAVPKEKSLSKLNKGLAIISLFQVIEIACSLSSDLYTLSFFNLKTTKKAQAGISIKLYNNKIDLKNKSSQC